MTGPGTVAVATGTMALAQVVTALVSPVPLLVLGGLVAPLVLAVVVLMLTPVLSTDKDRCERAQAVLDRVLAAIPGSRAVPGPGPIDSGGAVAIPPAVPVPSRPRRWWWGSGRGSSA